MQAKGYERQERERERERESETQRERGSRNLHVICLCVACGFSFSLEAYDCPQEGGQQHFGVHMRPRSIANPIAQTVWSWYVFPDG